MVPIEHPLSHRGRGECFLLCSLPASATPGHLPHILVFPGSCAVLHGRVSTHEIGRPGCPAAAAADRKRRVPLRPHRGRQYPDPTGFVRGTTLARERCFCYSRLAIGIADLGQVLSQTLRWCKEDNMARHILQYILAYGLWLVSAALAFAVFVQWRQFLLIDFPIMVLMPLGLSPYGQMAMDQFGTIILGLLCLAIMLISESYFHKLAAGEIGARQAAKVFAGEIIIFAVAFAGSLLVT